MTHIELVEKIIEGFQKQFKEYPVESENEETFRQGMIFAYKYLIEVLKNNGYPYIEED